MCGLFGFLGKPPSEQKDGVALSFEILKALAIMSIQRGTHATGFASVNTGDSAITIDKRPIASPLFVKRSLLFKQLPLRWPNIFIGHTRQATSGEPKHNRNNHPFTSGRFTLVHNGRIEKHEEIARKRQLTLRTETDSELLIKILDAHDTILPAIREIASLDLAIATAFISHANKNSQRLYLFRNTDRPLVTIYSKLLNTVFFVSTEQIWEDAIVKVMRREKAAFYKYLDLTIAELTPYLLSEIALEDGKVKWLEQVRIPPPISKATPAPPSKCNTPPPPEHKLIGTSVTTPTSSSLPPPATVKKAIDTPPTTEVSRAQLMVTHHGQVKRVISLLRDEPFMSAEEMSHWEDWRYKIVARSA